MNSLFSASSICYTMKEIGDISHEEKIVPGTIGKEIKIENLNAYVVKPNAEKQKAVIVIQDIFGWQFPDTRYMAEMLSSSGYIAVIPDFFGIDSRKFLNEEEISPQSLEERKPTDINKDVNVILKYLKEECGVQRIGVVGFCWGGAATHHLVLQYPEIKAGVSCCGIVCDMEDCELKSPTLFIFAEKDDKVKLDQVTKLETKLKERCTADFQVKVFPNQTHGFAHRKSEDISEPDRPYIQEARRDMITWLNKYL